MKDFEISHELQIEINRRLWIQALRENGHRQNRGTLSDDDGNVCALGLASEVLGCWTMLGQLKHNPVGALALPAQDNDDGWDFSRIAGAAEQGRYWE